MTHISTLIENCKSEDLLQVRDSYKSVPVSVKYLPKCVFCLDILWQNPWLELSIPQL